MEVFSDLFVVLPKKNSTEMADEDLALNEDQLLENLDETNGDNEAELINENEVSKKQKYFSPQHL